jgi:O-antigen ligase
VSAAAAYWRRLGPSGRAGAAMLLALFATSLFVMKSRTAIGVALALIVLLGIAWWPRARMIAIATLLAAGAVVAVALIARVDVVKKHEDRAAEQRLAYRTQIWNTARAAWQLPALRRRHGQLQRDRARGGPSVAR